MPSLFASSLPLSLLGHVEIAAALLQAGAEKDMATSDNGRTPLHVAASRGRSQVVQLLLSQGVEADWATTDHGRRALHLAAAEGHVEVMTVLMDHGVDKDVSAADGMTPMHLAASNGRVEALQALLEKGAAKDAVTSLRSRIVLFSGRDIQHLGNLQWEYCLNMCTYGRTDRQTDRHTVWPK